MQMCVGSVCVGSVYVCMCVESVCVECVHVEGKREHSGDIFIDVRVSQPRSD